jgi:hypothetical protein
VQQVLGRVGAGVGAEQDRRLAGVEVPGLATARVLAARGVEALDGRAVVRPAQPAVRGAELEARQLGPVLDQVQRGEHLLGVHAVAMGAADDAHGVTSWVVVVGGRRLPARGVPDIGATTQPRAGDVAGCT